MKAVRDSGWRLECVAVSIARDAFMPPPPAATCILVPIRSRLQTKRESRNRGGGERGRRPACSQPCQCSGRGDFLFGCRIVRCLDHLLIGGRRRLIGALIATGEASSKQHRLLNIYQPSPLHPREFFQAELTRALTERGYTVVWPALDEAKGVKHDRSGLHAG
jgi:hypothetical protein